MAILQQNYLLLVSDISMERLDDCFHGSCTFLGFGFWQHELPLDPGIIWQILAFLKFHACLYDDRHIGVIFTKFLFTEFHEYFMNRLEVNSREYFEIQKLREVLRSFLSLLDFVSRATVVAQASVICLSVCPLTEVSQKLLHGSRAHFVESYLSAIYLQTFFYYFFKFFF